MRYFILQEMKISLAVLPKGKWIGGTIPYFMDAEGGVVTKEKVFVNRISEHSKDVKIDFYNEESKKCFRKKFA